MANAHQFETHRVENQPVALGAYNAWSTDLALREAVQREGGGWAAKQLDAYGHLVGGELIAHGFAANENRPVLRAFDAYGRRVDEVEFHPSYHRLMAAAMQHGMNGFAWNHQEQAGAQVARAAILYMGSQADAGTACPMSMTHAAIPALRHASQLAQRWIPKLLSADYDPRSVPMEQKTGCTIGMGMTEKQGGSDVRANTTRATRSADGSYQIVGHKWFYSAPMCDAHLVLAQAEQGISCFLVPRFCPDGSRNATVLQRLKNKLGDWSNASSEVEFCGAHGELVGQEGRGIATIIEMVSLTRLDCMVSSAAQMRQATIQALHHTRQRRAFGKALIDQPLMRNVLADLALESEAAVALAMRIARAVDASARSDHESALARLGTAVGKYWICKRTPAHVNEAQECLGGLGYVEDSIMPRLYRQAPLNSIWEGSGNVQCLDVLRAIGRDASARDALFAELRTSGGQVREYDAGLVELAGLLDDTASLEYRSRFVVERIALMLQASLLLRASEPSIAAAFCRSRIGGRHGLALGTLDVNAPVDRLIERADVV